MQACPPAEEESEWNASLALSLCKEIMGSKVEKAERQEFRKKKDLKGERRGIKTSLQKLGVK